MKMKTRRGIPLITWACSNVFAWNLKLLPESTLMYLTKQRFRIQILAPQLIGGGTQWVAGHLMSSSVRRMPWIITSLDSRGLRAPNTVLLCGQDSASAIIPASRACARSVASDSLQPMDCSPPGSSVHRLLQVWKLEWVCHAFLQCIFPTQGLNPCLLRVLPASATWEAHSWLCSVVLWVQRLWPIAHIHPLWRWRNYSPSF